LDDLVGDWGHNLYLNLYPHLAPRKTRAEIRVKMKVGRTKGVKLKSGRDHLGYSGPAMNRSTNQPTVACLLFGVLVALCGCSDRVDRLDDNDRADPLVRLALEKQEEGDLDEAVRLLRGAVNVGSGPARAHLDLAILLQEHSKDYVDAIHHYRRYLILRPETEKNDMIRGRIREAGDLFAASVFPGGRAAEMLQLREENAGLKERIESLEKNARGSE